MRCENCGVDAVEEEAKFCTGCGSELRSSAEPSPTADTMVIPTTPAHTDIDATGELRIDSTADDLLDELAVTRLIDNIHSDELTATARIVATEQPTFETQVVWADEDRPFDDTIDDTPVGGIAFDAAVTQVIPVDADLEPPTPVSGTPSFVWAEEPPSLPPMNLTVTATIGIVATLIALLALTADVLSISTTAGPELNEVAQTLGLQTGVWHVEHLGSTLVFAGLLSAIGLAIGSVSIIRRHSWGAGLVGGCGLSITAVCSLAIGLVESPITTARTFASTATGDYVIEITRHFGYWALFAAAGVGLVAFFACVNDLLVDRQVDLNPVVNAIGALGAVIAALGPLMPMAGANWGANWTVGGVDNWPAEIVIGRLIYAATIAIGGTIGVLSVRRTGLGLATGTLVPSAVIAVSTWLGIGRTVISPGFGNPGSTPDVISTTTLGGYIGVVLVLAISWAIAWDRR